MLLLTRAKKRRDARDGMHPVNASCTDRHRPGVSPDSLPLPASLPWLRCHVYACIQVLKGGNSYCGVDEVMRAAARGARARIAGQIPKHHLSTHQPQTHRETLPPATKPSPRPRCSPSHTSGPAPRSRRTLQPPSRVHTLRCSWCRASASHMRSRAL